MHGNQQLGPIALLHLYPYLKILKPYRVLIFAVSNPSGYSQYQRQTYPTNIDANRDFPFDSNNVCYRTDSTVIIDQIYRKWKIDISVSVHNGGQELAWPWGSLNHKIDKYTAEEEIYNDIGKALMHVGGNNNIMNQLKIGTMNDAVYGVKGSYEDWAYAGSWQKNQLKCTLPQDQYQDYKVTMMNGLVFLFELGPHNLNQQYFGTSTTVQLGQNGEWKMDKQSFYNTNIKENGFISRAIRMFILLVKVANPQLTTQLEDNKISLRAQGCKNAILNITFNGQDGITIATINNKAIRGNLIDYQLEELDEITLYTQECIVQYKYRMVCDQEWIGKGKTAFGSNVRVDQGKGTIKLNRKNKNMPNNIADIHMANIIADSQNIVVFGIGVIIGSGIVGIGILIYCLLRRDKRQPIISQVEEVVSKPMKESDNQLF